MKSWPEQYQTLDNLKATDPLANAMFWGFVNNNRDMVKILEAEEHYTHQIPGSDVRDIKKFNPFSIKKKAFKIKKSPIELKKNKHFVTQL